MTEDAASRSIVAYVRRVDAPRGFLIVIANWTPVPRQDYRVREHESGAYRMILNSDAERWGGSSADGVEALATEAVLAHPPQLIVLMLPPLAM